MKTRRVFKSKDMKSGDGMLTTVWGPSLWHFLHTMRFNYPVQPTAEQKKQYKEFMQSLVHILPCKYCRLNLVKNFKTLPLKHSDMENRDTFSRYVYKLHELINTMLGKKSNLSYCDVRERYEHFRAGCNQQKKVVEKGCTEPIVGKKSKTVIQVIPHEIPCDTIQISPECLAHREN